AVVLERGGGLRQAFGDSTQTVSRDGGCQRPVGGAGGPIGPLPAEAENRLPVVARTCAQQRREEPDGVVGIRLVQLVDHLVVQLRDIPGRTIRLRSQRVEQQDRPPQVLRFVDGVARGARGTDQEGRGARPIALALGGLDARFQEGWMLGREPERAVDQFLRVFHPAELTKEQRLCAQRFRAFAFVVQQRFFAVMERERLVLPPGGG